MGFVTNDFDRNQYSLIPMSLDEMIGENNPVRVVEAFVDTLDLSFCKYHKPKNTGRPPYNPKDLMKLYVYGYFNGIRTSRKLEKECKRNIELMWLLENLAPDDKTICDFRKENKQAVTNIFKQFSMLCNELDLVGKEIVAIDGSKFRACNSRRNNLTKNKVAKMLKHYEECAAKYMELLDTNTEPEGVELTKEKLEKALSRISELSEMAKHIERHGEISTTDPDSRHMSVSNNGTDVSHNVQIAVDSKYDLIIAIDVNSQPQDNGQLGTMAEKAKTELEVDKIVALADKGYYNGKCLKYCQENGITAIVSKQKMGSHTGDENFSKDKFQYDKERDVYVCPMGNELTRKSTEKARRAKYRTDKCASCSKKSNCTTGKKGREITETEYRDAYKIADKLFKENKELYKKRQMIVEHPFGTIKRSFGFGYFLTIGNENVENETYWHCLTYNLKRVINIVGIAPLIAALKQKCAQKKAIMGAI